MKNFIKFWVWCFPQTLLGLILTITINCYVVNWGKDRKIAYFKVKRISSFALGKYLFIKSGTIDQKTFSHEYGHCKQSDILGWFYLPSVGLVSVFWNIVSRYSKKAADNYFNRWPENWADKLGGVTKQ